MSIRLKSPVSLFLQGNILDILTENGFSASHFPCTSLSPIVQKKQLSRVVLEAVYKQEHSCIACVGFNIFLV